MFPSLVHTVDTVEPLMKPEWKQDIKICVDRADSFIYDYHSCSHDNHAKSKTGITKLMKWERLRPSKSDAVISVQNTFLPFRISHSLAQDNLSTSASTAQLMEANET